MPSWQMLESQPRRAIVIQHDIGHTRHIAMTRNRYHGIGMPSWHAGIDCD